MCPTRHAARTGEARVDAITEAPRTRPSGITYARTTSVPFSQAPQRRSGDLRSTRRTQSGRSATTGCPATSR